MGGRTAPGIAWVVAAIDVILAFGAPVWNYQFTDADIGLQAGAGAIAVATFTGILATGRQRNGTNYDAMRDAIAAAFVVVYLVIVGWSSFFNWFDSSASNEDSVNPVLNPLTATFTTNFTALTGVVIAFYFGSKTVERVTDARIRGGASAGINQDNTDAARSQPVEASQPQPDLPPS